MRQVISINGRKYAVGLIWQPLAVDVVARNYSRKLSRGINKKLDLYSEHKAMICLGSESLGHRDGMYVAAAEVIENFSEFSSFLSVFKHEDGFWLLAVRNGIVLEDVFFEDEVLAHSEYEKLSDMPDWGAFFAPESWKVPRAMERNLSDVILGDLKVSLQPISRVKRDLISFVMVSFLLMMGSYLFKDILCKMFCDKPQVAKIDPILAAEYKKQIEQNKLNKKEYKNTIAKKQVTINNPLVMPYDILPAPDVRAKLCYTGIAFLMQPVSGWSQNNARCREGYVDVGFKRRFGNLDEFYEIVTQVMPGVLIEQRSKSEFYVRTNLPLLPAVSSLEERDPDTIIRGVNSLFQKLGMTADINNVIDVVSDGEQSENLNVVEIAVESKLIPPEFIKIFKEYSGVYMSLASWNAESRTWNYEVIIYAK